MLKNILIDTPGMIIENWGTIGYREGWERQKEYSRLLIDARGKDSGRLLEKIIFCVHQPVYTIGFHGDANNLLVNRTLLKNKGIDCVRIERGGDITYHGPGQLVAYPIIDLNRHNLGVKRYVETLERGVRQLLSEYGIMTTSNNDQIGVWLDWGSPMARKICAIGIKVSHGITMHGLALNVNTDLSAFNRINPCGITDKGVTSMQKELDKELSVNEVATRLGEILTELLE